jgi:uncharacterized membrane protein
MAGGSRRQRGEIPLDLVLIIVLVVAVGAALVWALRGSLFYTALIIVLVLAALVWAYARRIRRREDMSADQQRKVRHDASWTSGKEDE